MSGGRIPVGVIDRYTTGSSNPGTMDKSSSRMGHSTSPEMEMSNCCRNFLMSRLRAAELMNQQLSDDARGATNSRLRSVRPPGEFNVDLAIEQLRAQVASLLDSDIGVIRHLLAVNEQIEEMKWQRKFGGGDGSPWTPSTYMSGSCIESVDLDPDMDPLDPLFIMDPDLRDPRLVAGRELDDDVRRHVMNGCFNDDVTDDVFHNDDTAAMRAPFRSNDGCLSSQVRFKVTPNKLKVNSPDDKNKVNRSKVEFRVKDQKNAEDSKTAKVEFQVNRNKVADSDKVISSHTELKVKGLDDINDKLKTAKVEFKVDGAKDIETKPPSSQVEIRFLINSNDAIGQGHSDVEGQSRRIAAEPPCQTGAAESSQCALPMSRDVKPTSGSIRRQCNLEHGPQLRLMNVGQGYRPGQAGITTPRKVIEAPFLVAGENEASETLVVHL